MSFRCDKCNSPMVTVPGKMLRGDTELNVMIGAKPNKIVTKIRSDRSIIKEESWCDSCINKNADFTPTVINIACQESSPYGYTKITRE